MMNLESLFTKHKEPSLSGRYLSLEHLNPLLNKYLKLLSMQVEGFSEEDRKVHSITLGTGNFKILMWSQMHGNETTTTKAIFDILNFLNSKGELQQQILKNCTLKILPMLNPDGAQSYSRENANKVDLNRDAQLKSQKETQVLFKVFDAFKPHLCLNMHDQRSLFSAGNLAKSAVISFLAPAADEAKTIEVSRAFAMQLIAMMEQNLQQLIPNHIGRYDDSFNINCFGDTFQSLGVPTILFEAGHFPGDYQREKTRKYIFYALIFLLNVVSDSKTTLPDVKDYFLIPENKKLIYDIILRDVKNMYSFEKVDIAIQFEEKLVGQNVDFVPKIIKTGDLSAFFSHKEIIVNGGEVSINGCSSFEIGQIVSQLVVQNKNISMI